MGYAISLPPQQEVYNQEKMITGKRYQRYKIGATYASWLPASGPDNSIYRVSRHRCTSHTVANLRYICFRCDSCYISFQTHIQKSEEEKSSIADLHVKIKRHPGPHPMNLSQQGPMKGADQTDRCFVQTCRGRRYKELANEKSSKSKPIFDANVVT
jgi:hypothetical protein